MDPIRRSSTYRPSAYEIDDRRERLARADYGVVHPSTSGIRTRRSERQEGQEFADYTRDVRVSAHSLMDPPEHSAYEGEPTGRRMMRDLDRRTEYLNPGATPTPYRPATSVNIYSGRGQEMPMRQAPRHEGTYDSLRPAYRYGGQPGSGRPSEVHYDETASRNRNISLGHEMTHAWRAAHGVSVSPLEISQHSRDPVFSVPPPEYRAPMRQSVEERLRLREEFETIGLHPTPHTPEGWAPTENAIRREHGMPTRRDYSGLRPENNSAYEAFANFDEGTDDRRFYEKSYKRSPLDRIAYDLER